MEMFNILKPDIINDEKALEFYFKNLQNKFGINDYTLYRIDNWVYISRLIYELDVSNKLDNVELVRAKRKQLLITILGYYIYYKNKSAFMNIYKIADENTCQLLKELNILKKDLRKKYVLNTDKYYLKILNQDEIDFDLPLKSIDLDNIQTKVLSVPYWKEISNPKYNMIFFNKVHFPDPNVEEIRTEINILRENGVFSKNNLVRRVL